MIKKTIFAAALLLTIPLSAHAQIGLLGLPPALTGSNQNGAQNDIAYNDKQRVYLQVWGHPVVYGRFLDQNGVALFAEPFVIAATGVSDAYPRVIYTTGGADDVFIVRFTSEITRGQHVFTRLVRYTANGPEMGPVQHVFGVGAEIARAGGLAFNPAKRQFFLTWETSNLGWEVFGQLWQLLGTPGAPLSPTTAAAGPATPMHNLTEMSNGQGLPNVAYDYVHDSYLMVFKAEHPSNALVEGSWSMRIRFDQNNVISKSAPFELNSGGKPVEQGVVYMPEADAFLTYWTEVYSVRDVFGRFLDHNGVATSGVFPIINTAGNEGAADAAYSPYTRSIYMAAMRDVTRWIQGIELTANGTVANFFQSTTVVPPPPLESFYPSIAVGHDGRFGLSYVNTFQFVYVEMLGAPVVPGGSFIPGWGDGSNVPPPPPPPPACNYSLSQTGTAIPGAPTSLLVQVTADASCSWTATSNTAWLRVASGGSGSGNGTVTVTVDGNATGAIRSGTLSIAGQTFSVTQARMSAATHDLNGDGLSDLVWHNQATGDVSGWYLSGRTVIGTYGFSINGVADTNWKVMGSGDLNGDGYADLVWQHTDGSVVAWMVRALEVIETSYLSIPRVDPAWRVGAVGDLNGDGRADLVWRHSTSGMVVIWFMNGYTVVSSSFPSISTVSDTNWAIVAASDLNADGRADLVWQNNANGYLVAWFMNGAQVLGSGLLSIPVVPDLTWKIRGVGDFNGDLRGDIVWQNTASGLLVIWYMDGLTVLSSNFPSISAISNLNWVLVGPG